ncbi:MAG TPA: glycosyltransferase family 4 protein [Solirubrobacterales bacterium]
MNNAVEKVLMGIYFYPRGGSAHSARALARQLEVQGLDVTLVSGSRTDLGPIGDAHDFYKGLDVRPVDFTPALRSGRPLGFTGAPGTAPMHGSFEDRPDAPDAVLTSFDDKRLELQVDAWARELEAAAAGGIDRLYLHHLTPLNEAAARALPGVPIIGHIHGTELLMLEAIEAEAPSGGRHVAAWAERLRRWAAECERLVVGDEKGVARAARLLDLPAERFAVIPNGFDPVFAPRTTDRDAVWQGTIGLAPRGTVLAYVGRFTAVKRLPVLIEAFALAQEQVTGPASLVLIGGHPGEWEGEHPAKTIERLGVGDVHLAGWHAHEELPRLLNAADALVHASVAEQFGQVLVEAMACGLPVIAVDRGGPSTIVDDPETGWLVEPDDPAGLAAAMVRAIADPGERRRRGRRARQEVIGRYAWSEIGREAAALVRGGGITSRVEGMDFDFRFRNASGRWESVGHRKGANWMVALEALEERTPGGLPPGRYMSRPRGRQKDWDLFLKEPDGAVSMPLPGSTV